MTRASGRAVHAITFDYGQRHRAELDAAVRVAAALGCASHRIVRVDLRAIGGSALTDDVAVPKGRTADAIGRGIPATYVPARNTVFLSLALGLAETVGADEVVIGANALDYSGYPDCREPYLRSFEATANLATAAGVAAAEAGRTRFRVEAPLVRMTKAEIVRRGVALDAPLHLTHSCYDPVGPDARPCGECDSCLLRKKGFAEAGVTDPGTGASSQLPASRLGTVEARGDGSEEQGTVPTSQLPEARAGTAEGPSPGSWEVGTVPAAPDAVASLLPEPRGDSLLVTEIYPSIQGESTFAGVPFVLVRLARCNLRCVWCDSEFTFKGGVRRTIEDVLADVRSHLLPHVLVTGGEPLLQPAVHELMTRLCNEEYTVLLETGGSLDIAHVDPRVRREDLAARVGAVLVSPVHGDPELPRRIAAWLLEDRLPARLQLQIHKVIWDPAERRR